MSLPFNVASHLDTALRAAAAKLGLADRGLWARWLFRRIVKLGWHPLLRINQSAKFRPAGQPRWYWLRELVRDVNQRWCSRGTAFVSSERRLDCTLVAWWGEGYTDPWCILTDVPPEAREACWYGLRAWIEPGFKVTKRAGWQWQRTRMTEPQRAARLWLAVAVATLWRLSVGGMADAAIPDRTRLDGSAALGMQRRQRRATRLRLVSAFRRGWTLILVARLDHEPLPIATFLPEPWPTVSLSNAPGMVHDSGVLDDVAA